MKSASAKLTTEQVIAIKKLLSELDKWGRRVWSASEIARTYCAAGTFISAEAIRRIDRGESWGWLQMAEDVSQKKPMSEEMRMAAAASQAKVLERLNADRLLSELQADPDKPEEELSDFEKQRRAYGGGIRDGKD